MLCMEVPSSCAVKILTLISPLGGAYTMKMSEFFIKARIGAEPTDLRNLLCRQGGV